jgi:hypothetical protein
MRAMPQRWLKRNADKADQLAGRVPARFLAAPHGKTTSPLTERFMEAGGLLWIPLLNH